MTPEAFLERLETAPQLSAQPGLVSAELGLIRFVERRLRLPPSLWNHQVDPAIWRLRRKALWFKDLKTAQPHLAPEKLAAMVRERDLARLRQGTLIVLFQDDELLIFDGNHRANALRLFGEETVGAVVVHAAHLKEPFR